MRRNIVITLLVLIIFLVCFACEPETENSDKGFFFDEETFTANWNSWKNMNAQNYSFTLTGGLPYWIFRSNYTMMREYEVNIIVKNGIMDSFEYIGGTPYEDDEETIFTPEFTSISDVYQKVSDRVKREKDLWNNNYYGEGIISRKYEITYDTHLFYIKYFQPISLYKAGYAVDISADHVVTVSNFSILD